jgi:hypothetical protein
MFFALNVCVHILRTLNQYAEGKNWERFVGFIIFEEFFVSCLVDLGDFKIGQVE